MLRVAAKLYTIPALTLSTSRPVNGRCYEAVPLKFQSYTLIPNIFPFISLSLSLSPDCMVFVYIFCNSFLFFFSNNILKARIFFFDFIVRVGYSYSECMLASLHSLS